MKSALGALLLLGGSFLWAGEDPPGEAKNIYGVLLQAIQDGDSSVFQELGNEAFRKQMTPELFQSAREQIGDRLRGGYTSAYLGKVLKNGKEMCLWKIAPTQNSEQLLVTLVLENNKVAAFYFQ